MAKRPLINPGELLKELRRLEPAVASSDLSPKQKTLRTSALKRPRELHEACLFCYGLSCQMEQPVSVIDDESADYDFVAFWRNGETNYFTPVQLKEVVPPHLNSNTSIQSIIDGLIEYRYSQNLTVAIRINQTITLDLDRLTIPPALAIAGLWIYGSASPDGSKWFLAGNLIEPEPNLGWLFDYPAD